jgi:Kef-type K+ transport system membrane component KefB
MPVPPKRFGVLVAYIAMLIAAVGGYLLIRAAGADLVASAPAADRVIRSEWIVTDPLAEVLLALALITLVARAMGVLFRRLLRQPPVIGEIFAGLALGPSLLGTVSPTLQAFVLPPDAAPFVGMIAKVGVVLFMFLVGLDLDMKAARKHGQATVIIAHASIITPFLLGALLALGLYPLYAAQDVDFTVFSLFIGVAMSVTAFPVLARILSDFKAQRTRLGGLALSSAAVGDARVLPRPKCRAWRGRSRSQAPSWHRCSG